MQGVIDGCCCFLRKFMWTYKKLKSSSFRLILDISTSQTILGLLETDRQTPRFCYTEASYSLDVVRPPKGVCQPFCRVCFPVWLPFQYHEIHGQDVVVEYNITIKTSNSTCFANESVFHFIIHLQGTSLRTDPTFYMVAVYKKKT